MLVKPTFEAVYYIAQRMRAIDQREVFALRWTDNKAVLTQAVLKRSDLSWIATASDGEPVYVCGVIPDRPGVWSLWGFSTDRWPAVMLTVTRHIRRRMVPMIGTEVAHRVDVMSLAEKIEGHRWLEFLGAKKTADLDGYGRNGEDFKLFTWRA